MSILRNIEPRTLYNMVTGCFENGLVVDIDDEWLMYDDRGMLFSYLGGVISVDNVGMLSAFPGQGDVFEAARLRAEAARRQQAQQRGR